MDLIKETTEKKEVPQVDERGLQSAFEKLFELVLITNKPIQQNENN